MMYDDFDSTIQVEEICPEEYEDWMRSYYEECAASQFIPS